MISPLRATGIIATGTAVSLLVSAVTSKAIALLIGPTGLGIYGLMQSVLGAIGLVFGLGIATALVRSTAGALGAIRRDEVPQLRATAWLIGLLMAIAMAALGLVGRDWVADAVFGDARLARVVPVLGLSAGLTLLWSIESGALNGHHRIAVLTRATIVSSVLGGVAIVIAVAALGVEGVAVGLFAVAALGFGVTLVLAARSIGPPVVRSSANTIRAARELLAVGIPFALSQVASTGAQLVLPVMILYQLNAEAVGFFRAAFTISVGYLAFVLTALAQDYYPRVAAAPIDELRELVERRTRLILAIGVPVILAMLALAPVVVAVLYSSEFDPATRILQWQLIGDLLKLPAWAMVFAILARGRAGIFLAVEIVGGVSLIAAVAIGVERFGLEGAGIGYLAAYAIYYAVAWLAVRTVAPLVPGRLQVTVVGLAVLLVALDLAMRDATAVRSGLLLAAAATMGAVAWPRLWRLHRAGEL